ncbi:hypothetical protein DFS34DRAFT_674258 [Phlyctochytrium arcticum]|nr:hypothetical protein DFS34DRAFT_674258 [Phlyctochytrium arcticum]
MSSNNQIAPPASPPREGRTSILQPSYVPVPVSFASAPSGSNTRQHPGEPGSSPIRKKKKTKPARKAAPAPPPVSADPNVTNAVDEFTAQLETHKQQIANRNKNTADAYRPKIADREKWCADRKYANGTIVTEGKLLLFLQFVIKRGLKRRKVNKDGSDGGNAMTYSTISIYLAAAVDLWQQQLATKVHNLPHPTSLTIKKLVASFQQQKAKVAEKHLHDAGIGTLLDTYSTDDLIRLVDYWM